MCVISGENTYLLDINMCNIWGENTALLNTLVCNQVSTLALALMCKIENIALYIFFLAYIVAYGLRYNIFLLGHIRSKSEVCREDEDEKQTKRPHT